jgi:hypothetical protein
MSTYTIKGYRTIKGMDGDAYNVNLLRDGKKIAEVIYSGHGGPLDWDWCDRMKPRVEVEVAAADGTKYIVRQTQEEVRLRKYLEGKTYTLPGYPEEYPMDPDCFVDGLINDEMEKKQVLKWCRTKTVFRLKTDPENMGAWRTISVPFNQNVKVHLMKVYGDTLGVVMNEVLADELIAKKGNK